MRFFSVYMCMCALVVAAALAFKQLYYKWPSPPLPNQPKTGSSHHNNDSSSSASAAAAAGVEKQKKRTPAWCDRILWLPDRQLYQLAYGRGELAVREIEVVCRARACVGVSVCAFLAHLSGP